MYKMSLCLGCIENGSEVFQYVVRTFNKDISRNYFSKNWHG